MCIVYLMCVFHYFRIFSSFIVCIFRGLKKLWPRRLGAPECWGALVHCTTCYATGQRLKAKLAVSGTWESLSVACLICIFEWDGVVRISLCPSKRDCQLAVINLYFSMYMLLSQYICLFFL